MRVVYLIGAPGSGKSTAVRGATAHWSLREDLRKPFAHRVYAEGIVLGRDDPMFPGTDTLSMSVNPLAVAFVSEGEGLCVGEGDRLANIRFFSACPQLTLIHIDVSLWTARERVRERAEAHGQRLQDEAWWKGRATKVDNLRRLFPHVSVNGARTPQEVASDVRAIIEGCR